MSGWLILLLIIILFFNFCFILSLLLSATEATEADETEGKERKTKKTRLSSDESVFLKKCWSTLESIDGQDIKCDHVFYSMKRFLQLIIHRVKFKFISFNSYLLLLMPIISLLLFFDEIYFQTVCRICKLILTINATIFRKCIFINSLQHFVY